MSRPGPGTWTALLLLGGGVLLGLLGIRHFALEREQTDRNARAVEQRALAEAVSDAPRLARQPRDGPERAWQLEPGRLTGTDEPVPAQLYEWNAAARLSARTSPDVRFKVWKQLTTDDRPAWLRHIASYHAGVAALELQQTGVARQLFAAAREAHTLLVFDGVRVRAAALQQLALQGLKEGTTQDLERFLDDALDGRRLALGDVVGPEDLLIALDDQVRKQQIELPAASAARLGDAARRARDGVELLRSVPERGDLAVVAERVVHHTPIDLQVHDLQSLVAPPPGYAAKARAAVVPAGAVLGPLSARLVAPLDGVVVTVDREPLQAKSLLMLFALALGLGLYAVGAVLALRGWRRSREAARMQADFTAAVSHEMKTPIASVRAMAEMLEDGDPDLVRRYAGRIGSEMQRLGATVRNVLDAARIERGVLPVRPLPADPAALVARTVQQVLPELERRGFHVEMEVLPSPGPVPVDADALDAALRNLLDNAAKFSPEVKRIRVEATPVADGYRIAVLDRGIGLEEGQHQRLFERFYRGAAARDGAIPGVGLGLHIAREMIDAHGGSLTARRRAGGGAAFEILLPSESRAP